MARTTETGPGEGAQPQVDVYDTPAAASARVAREIARAAREAHAAGRTICIALAAGRTPLGLYEELVRMSTAGALPGEALRTFALDEYADLDAGDPRSFRSWLNSRVLDPVGVPAGRRSFPSPVPDGGALYEEAIAAAGGLDMVILGIGLNGHVAFNEPGADSSSRTRLIALTTSTRRANAPIFAPDPIPTRAITVGVGTILGARRIRLLAFGEAKAEIVARAATGPMTPDVPASLLRAHPDLRFVLDRAAARALR